MSHSICVVSPRDALHSRNQCRPDNLISGYAGHPVAYTIQSVAGYKIKRHDAEALLQPVVVDASKQQKRGRKTTRKSLVHASQIV